MITILRWILLPISIIYWLIVWFRNKLYDHGLLKSRQFNIPTIVVGNLAVGGTGKSPMTEYLIRLLKDQYRIATLSRGYGRKTKGYRTVNLQSTTSEVGDEPLQFKRKFPNITVAVSEDRCHGVQILQHEHDLILLDDAYQHRKLKPGFSILLFDFASLFKSKLTLPTGNLRDNFEATKRADLIFITKCPDMVEEIQKIEIERRIRKHTLAPIFYTGIKYDIPLNTKGEPLNVELKDFEIVLFCGIANPKPLENYLSKLGNNVHLIDFPDHHNYTDKDIIKIKSVFQSIPSNRKIIISTEKDIQRLHDSSFSSLPLYYIPIRLKTIDQQQETFDHFILNYLNQSAKR